MNQENNGSPVPLRPPVNFTSRPDKEEWIAIFVYLPIHILLLPSLLGFLMYEGYVSETAASVLAYAIGAVYMLVICRKFLRRDFDALCDRPFQVAAEVLGSYALMFGCNMLLSILFSALLTEPNPNNEAITSMAGASYGPTAAMAVYLAPILEELLFRAGVFGLIRRYHRVAAYVISIALFSLYHVWNFALTDPVYWIFVLQYIPVTYLLCRCYENTNCIWTSIFFHMLINGISMRALSILEGMV